MRHSIDSVPDPSDESFVAFSCWTQELLHPCLRHFFVKSGTSLFGTQPPTLPLPDVVKSTPTGRYFWINLENASEEKAALWGREEQPSLQVNTLPTFKPLKVWPANWPLGMIFRIIGVEFKEALQGPNPENFRNTAPRDKIPIWKSLPFFSLYILSGQNLFRRAAIWIARWIVFEWIIILTIIGKTNSNQICTCTSRTAPHFYRGISPAWSESRAIMS